MLILHGSYRWFKKKTAFRHDYCRQCRAQTLSIQVQSWDFIHLFFVPLIPLGRWRRWHCIQCGNNPHQQVGTHLFFKVTGTLILLFFAIISWFAPDEQEIWVMRALLIIGFGLAVWGCTRHRPEPSFKENLSRVTPYSGQECLICGDTLRNEVYATCTSCHAKHLPLTT